MVRHLQGKYKTDLCQLSTGKNKDVIDMVDKEYKIFVLDIPRDVKQEEIPYRSIEKIKDGVIISSKY